MGDARISSRLEFATIRSRQRCQSQRVGTILPQMLIGEASLVIPRAVLEPSETNQWV